MPCADAADTDDLAGYVDHLEPFQELPPIILQRGAAGTELLLNRALHLLGRDTKGCLHVTRPRISMALPDAESTISQLFAAKRRAEPSSGDTRSCKFY